MWGDVLTIALVLVALWTFLPRHLRRAMWSALSPALTTLLDTLHEGALVLRKGLTVVGYKVLIGNMPMSSSAAADDDDWDTESTVSRPKQNSETPEIPQRVGEIQGETFSSAETEALARLVASGKLGLTDAVKIGAGAVSGEKYQKRSREIKEAVARIQQRYPRRTPEQEALRRELGIEKR